jgi:hypothetical protein
LDFGRGFAGAIKLSDTKPEADGVHVVGALHDCRFGQDAEQCQSSTGILQSSAAGGGNTVPTPSEAAKVDFPPPPFAEHNAMTRNIALPRRENVTPVMSRSRDDATAPRREHVVTSPG